MKNIFSRNNKMEIKSINYRKYIIAFAVMTGAIVLLNVMFRVSPTFSTNYCRTIFASVSKIFGAFWGLFPFSVIEIILYLCAGIIAYCIIRLVIRLIKYHRKSNICFFTYKLKRYLLNLVCIILAALIILTLNDISLYNRLSFSEAAAINTSARSTEELIKVFEILRNDINENASKVNRNEDGIFTISDTDISKDTPIAMSTLKEDYPFMPNYYPRPKKILSSKLMSHTRLQGIYSPYTLEANYNNDMPDAEKLHTACHELAHLAGFIHEDEANFIGYLACVKSDNPEFVYSGSLSIISYFLSELRRNVSNERYVELVKSIDINARKDMIFIDEYWSRFDTKVAKVSGKINNAFIISNGDKEGERRYSMVVDLVLAHYLD